VGHAADVLLQPFQLLIVCLREILAVLARRQDLQVVLELAALCLHALQMTKNRLHFFIFGKVSIFLQSAPFDILEVSIERLAQVHLLPEHGLQQAMQLVQVPIVRHSFVPLRVPANNRRTATKKLAQKMNSEIFQIFAYFSAYFLDQRKIKNHSSDRSLEERRRASYRS